jgi:hypothetical protein
MMAASPGEWLEAETARAATTITCHGNCGAACPWAVDTASARLDPETGLQTGPFELRHSLAHRATSAPAEEVQPPGPLVTGTTAFLSQTLRWLLSRWHHGDLRHHARCGSADAPSAPPRAVPAAYFRPVQGPIAAHPSAWEPLYGGFALQLADLVAEHLVRPGDAFTDLRDIAVQLTRADPVIKDADLTKLAVQTMHHTAQRHGLLRYRPRRPDDPGKRIEGRTRIWAVSEAAPDLVHQIRGELSSLRPE